MPSSQQTRKTTKSTTKKRIVMIDTKKTTNTINKTKTKKRTTKTKKLYLLTTPGELMTQRSTKKMNKTDALELFGMLPEEIKSIITSNFHNIYVKLNYFVGDYIITDVQLFKISWIGRDPMSGNEGITANRVDAVVTIGYNQVSSPYNTKSSWKKVDKEEIQPCYDCSKVCLKEDMSYGARFSDLVCEDCIDECAECGCEVSDNGHEGRYCERCDEVYCVDCGGSNEDADGEWCCENCWDEDDEAARQAAVADLVSNEPARDDEEVCDTCKKIINHDEEEKACGPGCAEYDNGYADRDDEPARGTAEWWAQQYQQANPNDEGEGFNIVN